MNTHHDLDVLIIGFGTAGLAAASEVSKVTRNFRILSNGVYGTTCVLAGCMPSKVLIQAAEDFWSRNCMRGSGITGTEHLKVDTKAVLRHVRESREHFLRYTLEATENYRDHIDEGRAEFLSLNEVRAGNQSYRARKIILATGSRPIVPAAWQDLEDRILTSDSLFEQDDLPNSLGIFHLSVLGTELGQALGRLGVVTTAWHDGELIGGLSDPEVSAYAVKRLREEMDIHLVQTPSLTRDADGIVIDGTKVEKALITLSRQANLDGMGLEALNVVSPGMPVMQHDPETMQLGDMPLYVAGDVKLGRSILSEATDEGHIAGYNAARPENTRFKRRTPLLIAYTRPAIVVTGIPYDALDLTRTVIGESRFDNQGRARIMGLPSGIIRLYADKETACLLGAEMFVPMGDHLGHMISWLIDRRLTVSEALQLPFYHPSIEEGIRSALRDLDSKLTRRRPLPDC